MAIINDLPCVSGGGTTIDILWTNPNPTSSFSAQTINIDLSNYAFIFIVSMTLGSREQKITSGLFPVIAGTLYMLSSTTGGQTPMHVERMFTVNNTSIAFNGGMEGGVSSNNNYMIPNTIYGVK